MCAKTVYLGSCAICVYHIATSPLLPFFMYGPYWNLNFTQHITRDSGGGGDTVLFTRITFVW